MRYIVDWVDKGCQWFTSVYSIGRYSKYVEHSNIKEYETDKKMRILWQDICAKDIYDFCCREFGEENVVSFI